MAAAFIGASVVNVMTSVTRDVGLLLVLVYY